MVHVQNPLAGSPTGRSAPEAPTCPRPLPPTVLLAHRTWWWVLRKCVASFLSLILILKNLHTRHSSSTVSGNSFSSISMRQSSLCSHNLQYLRQIVLSKTKHRSRWDLQIVTTVNNWCVRKKEAIYLQWRTLTKKGGMRKTHVQYIHSCWLWSAGFYASCSLHGFFQRRFNCRHRHAAGTHTKITFFSKYNSL